MNTFSQNILLTLVVIAVAADKSREISDHRDPERRFLEDLNDEEWHIAHLRDTNVVDTQTSRKGCKEETFSDRIKRYRKSLRDDASLIDFVSSDPIPVNPEDLHDDCKDANSTANESSSLNSTKDTIEDITLSNRDKDSTNNSAEEAPKLNEDKEIKDTATTPVLKFKNETQTKGGKNGESVRRSEYQFSSVEYYDDTVDFDPKVCPDAVQVIVLEQDIIRNYDVECEMNLEWRSLE